MLAARNYYGLGVNYTTHPSAASALDEATGQGKWAGEKPIRYFSIAGPYKQRPSIKRLMEEMPSILGRGPWDSE